MRDRVSDFWDQNNSHSNTLWGKGGWDMLHCYLEDFSQNPIGYCTKFHLLNAFLMSSCHLIVIRYSQWRHIIEEIVKKRNPSIRMWKKWALFNDLDEFCTRDRIIFISVLIYCNIMDDLYKPMWNFQVSTI